MRSPKQITIRIKRDGTVVAETHGLKGKECLSVIPALQDALGAETVGSEYTSEYYEETAASLEEAVEATEGLEDRQHE